MKDSEKAPKLAVTIAEACESIHVSRTTLYEIIRAGRIRTASIGTRGIRIPVSEIEKFLESGGY